MSKDYGTLTDMGIFSREQVLRAYLCADFYPPLPPYLQNSIVEALREHWDGRMEPGRVMAAHMGLRSVAGIYKYFREFLNDPLGDKRL